MDERTTDVRFDGIGPHAIWQERLAAGEIAFQTCEGCSSAQHPPSLLCRACGSIALGWRCSAGAGAVYSTTTVRLRDRVYDVSLVDLDEGFRMMSRVEGVDPDAVRIGDRVEARIRTDEAQAAMVVFVPAGGAS